LMPVMQTDSSLECNSALASLRCDSTNDCLG